MLYNLLLEYYTIPTINFNIYDITAAVLHVYSVTEPYSGEVLYDILLPARRYARQRGIIAIWVVVRLSVCYKPVFGRNSRMDPARF